VNCLQFSRDGTQLAASGNALLRLYDVHSTSPINVMSNNTSDDHDSMNKNSHNLTCVQFDSNIPYRLYTGGEDGRCKLWDMRKRNLHCERNIMTEQMSVINCLTTKHRKFGCIYGTQTGQIIAWDHVTTHILYSKKSLSHVSIQSIDCHGENIAAIDNKGVVHYYVAEIEEWQHFKAHDKYGLRCVFSPDGRTLATGGSDRKLKLWDLDTFSDRLDTFTECAVFAEEKQKWVWDIAFADDGKNIFSASSDGEVRLWGIQDCIVKRRYEGHEFAVVCLSLYQPCAFND